MSRRRRRSAKQPNTHDQPELSPTAKAAAEAAGFWGEPDGEAGEAAPAGDRSGVERIRPTPDPAALPRSLGDPPLTPETAAAHHIAVVYEEAVRAATALAAANGLLDEGDLPA